MKSDAASHAASRNILLEAVEVNKCNIDKETAMKALTEALLANHKGKKVEKWILDSEFTRHMSNHIEKFVSFTDWSSVVGVLKYKFVNLAEYGKLS